MHYVVPAAGLRRQLAVLVALQTLAAIVMGGPMLIAGGLLGDRLSTFYFFRDVLHSLNVYGEFPWWNSSIWAGFPFYYFTFLYWPGRDPLFASTAAVVWLLGQLGVTIDSYFPLFVVYITFLVPLLLNLSILALARQVLRRPLAVYFVIVLAVFSPGVVVGLRDFGADVSAYGFLFAAAFLYFVRQPGRARFLLMCLPAMAMAALTFTQFFWNAVFLPVFVAAMFFGRGHLTRATRQAFRQVPLRWWLPAAAALAIYALPSALALASGDDIVSVRAAGGRYYGYEELRPGNPLEALAISTPGVGFNWTDYEDPGSDMAPVALAGTSVYSGFGYMGMLTLPLACLGLVLGRPYWSLRLFGGIAVVMTTVMLSAYSPIMSLAIAWPTPLRAINHHSDMVLRAGLFALFALAAGLGVEALMRPSPRRRWIVLALFGLTACVSIGFVLSLTGIAGTHHYLFGLTVALALLYGIALARLARARSVAATRAAFMVLFALVLLDTSAMAFAHMRLSLPHGAGRVREPGPDTIGSVIGVSEERVFYLRGLNDPALLTAPAEPMTGAAIDVRRRTYNLIDVRAETPGESRLVWRDAYFPFWRAWVNGAEVTVERTTDGMKAVRIPAGVSEVRFEFSPLLLRATMAAGYAAMMALALIWGLSRRRETAWGSGEPRR